jgi:hypothetical protein
MGLFFLAQGLWMLVEPAYWAESVVHLAAPDHLHFHFIADIGMAFLASGAGLLLGSRRGLANGAWAVAGATWPVLHALIHLHEWIMDGPPPVVGDLVKEGVGVILAGAFAAWLAWSRFRQGEA